MFIILYIDYTCFRDVMFCLRNKFEIPAYADFPNSVCIHDLCKAEELSYYSKEQIKYTIMKLTEIKFILCHGLSSRKKMSGREFIDDITMKGHNFLTYSSNEIIWKRATSSVKAMGMVSFEVFCELMNKIALRMTVESVRRM